MPNQHIQEIIEKQERHRYDAKENCLKMYGSEVENKHRLPYFNQSTQSLMCPPFWDSILCWPHTPAGVLAVSPCPSYIAGFKPEYNVTRKCTEDGIWFTNLTTHEPWANYTSCYEGAITTIFTNNSGKPGISKSYEAIVPAVKIISETGYAVSLISLLIAFLIMLLIRKLHCARNILHMNLFASFIMRAFFYILKDILFIDGVGLTNDLSERNGYLYFKTDLEKNNYECKLLTSLVQYFTTANYSWILMEGLYLNNLIFRALFADSSKNLIYYICAGWGLPLLVIILWIIARIFLDDITCWTMNDDIIPFLIIAIPTVISVLINFALFIIISIVLYTKLNSPICEDTQRYQKWAKSTLVLVPLFGVHYAILLIFYFIGQTYIWLIFDTLFGSFQGFFVAVLYCFLNGEVKTEMKPHITSILTYLATNRISRICFPCRQRILRLAVGRQSVCTTMSCSSIYANGVVHRGSKSRSEKRKQSAVQERDKNHHCNGMRPVRNGHVYNCNKCSSYCGQAETSLCIDPRTERKSTGYAVADEEICMLTRNC
ncbi:vasoactive intestinal polypeptide receptor 2 isoform X2 [Leptinotarsa decemlineata]